MRLELATVLLAVVVPLMLWRGTLSATMQRFRWDPGYLTIAWAPWALMALGVLCYAPVAYHRICDPARRFARRQPVAWHGWAISLYLLGFVLASQVAQLARGLQGP